MQPIGPLMHEHRLIERMVDMVRSEAKRLEGGDEADPRFLFAVVDFFRTYADRLHHGKEEDILFRELRNKELSRDHQRTLDELVEEHKQARGLVAELESAAGMLHREPDTGRHKALGALESLAELYPRHIGKEDQGFFHPVMDYFDDQEMDAMLTEFQEFEDNFVHQTYTDMVDAWEQRHKPDQER
jgi:hemerythrin-like domain-containing protein